MGEADIVAKKSRQLSVNRSKPKWHRARRLLARVMLRGYRIRYDKVVIDKDRYLEEAM